MKLKNIVVNIMDNKVYIALGTNMGKRKINLETAIEKMSKFSTITKRSSIYETDPVGYEKQDKFLNMAVEILTTLTPLDLLDNLQKIEKDMGRVKTILNGPRIIDLDIILYGQKVVIEKTLEIPHPRMHERKFVLEPLVEIADKEIHPILKCSIGNLLKKI